MSKTIFNRMTCRRLGAVGLFVAACLLSGSPAAAHQSPANCTGNNMGLDFLKNKTQIVSGDTFHFTIRARNDAAGDSSCPAAWARWLSLLLKARSALP